jgi:hypothetical protein
LVSFVGNEERYQCHFNYKIGDEIIYDGETFTGRICAYLQQNLMPPLFGVFYAGPKYKDPFYYAPFWYVPLSKRDDKYKLETGGWAALPEGIEEPSPYMCGRNLVPAGSYFWPPNPNREVCKDVMALCTDPRALAAFKIEAIDIAEKGAGNPAFFRKTMAALEVIKNNPGIDPKAIPQKLSQRHREELYPLAGDVFISVSVEQLEGVGFVELRDGKAYITEAGKDRWKRYVNSLTKEEKVALEIQA